MKIKFDSDDNLPLNKVLKFRVLTIIIRNQMVKNQIKKMEKDFLR